MPRPSLRHLLVGLALAACGPGGQAAGPTLPVAPPPPELPPAVPAVISTTHVDPMEGNDTAVASPILEVMTAENRRWMDALHDKEPPAYYLGYQITERRLVAMEAEQGAILQDDDETQRVLDVEVRVGDPQLDNRHPLRNDPLGFLSDVPRSARMPMGEDKEAVQSFLWLETDREYRDASSQLARVLTDSGLTAEREDRSPDFSSDEPQSYVQPRAELQLDKAAWIARLRKCSREADRGVATRATCRAEFEVETIYFVNSEGTRIQSSSTGARLMVSAGVKSDDGMPLGRLEQRFARTPAELPGDDEVERMIEAVNTDLDALHKAPVVDPYSGPAILEGPAAAVFFHEVFGHRIEGHRQKELTSGQTFAKKLGQAIMPDWLSVYDDPTLTTLNGGFLNGFYRFDDEGVRAQRVPLVTKGVLVGFLMARDPIRSFPHSNGHGRREPGRAAVSRQGNLIVEAARTVPDAELEKLLIEEIKRQGKPYGLIFTDISGGFTLTDRFAPQSFKVNPVMTYRLYPDGRKELVRGVDISGTPLIALSSIAAAGREVMTFNGVCGAESGWVPVSASAPSLLLTQLEVERSIQSNDRAPVLSPPSVRRTAGGAR